MTIIASRSRRLWACGLAVFGIVGVGAFLIGLTPWIAPLAALLGLTFAFGRWTSWSFALASSILALLAISSVLARVTPVLNIGLTGPIGAVLGIACASGVVVLFRDSRARLPRRAQALAACAVVMVLAAAVAVVIGRGLPGADFEWAMHNDAVWNVATTRFIIHDGGVDAATHPNSSPLTAIVMAVAAAVGRGDVPASALFEHDIVRFATFWLLAAGASCVFAGLIGYRAVPADRPVWRWVAALAAAFLPNTWFVFGVAADYGFFNGTVVVVLLCAVWLVWLDARAHPVLSAFMLSLAAVCFLATWAPLAVIPLALAVLALARPILASLRPDADGRAHTLLTAMAVLLPAPLYVVFVTLPDLRRDGAALSVDGAFIPFLPVHAMTIVVVALTVVLIVARIRNDQHTLAGTVVVTGSGAVALAYLLFQRRGVANLWGYYPAKFAWFVSILLLVILSAEIARGALSITRRRGWTVLGASLAVLVPCTLMAHVPPPQGWRTISTPLTIAMQWRSDGPSVAARTLFGLAVDGVPTVALGYGAPATDQFVNGWLLQLESPSSADPIRDFSYFLAPGDVEQTCQAILTWKRDVRVVTSDPTISARLAEECPEGRFHVDLLPSPEKLG